MSHHLFPNGEWEHYPASVVNMTAFPIRVKHWRRMMIRLEVWTQAQGGIALIELWRTRIQPGIRNCSHPPECRKPHNNAWCSMVKCRTNLGGCGAVLEYLPTTQAIAVRRAKAKGKKTPNMLERLENPDRCPRCNRAFQLSVGFGNQTILKCEGWSAPASTQCTMIKALPHEFLPCGPTRPSVGEQRTSLTGSGNSADVRRSQMPSSTPEHPNMSPQQLQ